MSKWELVKLSDIFDLQMGKTPSRNCKEYWNNGTYKWTSIADIGNADKYIYETKEKITEKAVLESNIKIVPKNTVIMSFKLSLGKTCITVEDIYTNEAIMAFLDKHIYDIDKNYMYHLFGNYNWKQNTNKAVKGVTLNKATLGETKIPLPPLEEQHKIASTLDTVSELLKFRKQQLDELDLLVKSRFVEMFGDPIENPKGFLRYTIDDVIEFQGGSQPDKKYFEYEKTEDNIRLIQIRDYKSNRYLTYIPKTMAKRFCSIDDIMIGRYGPPIFQILQGIEGSFNVALMKAIPRIGNKEFIRHFLKQDCLLRYLEGLSKRTAGQDGIQMDKLKSYPFPYPPIELQNKFADFVKQVDSLKSEVQKSINETQTLFDSLMQEYFE